MTRTFRKPLSRTSVPELDEFLRRALETGSYYEFMFPRNIKEFLRSAWEQHRDEILDHWQSAGSRPWIQWQLEIIPKFGERRLTHYAEGIVRDGWVNVFGYLHTSTTPPIQESEESYLDRLDLLTRHERKVLGKIVPAEERFRIDCPDLYQQLTQRRSS
jgi:hypothetical protein